MNLFSILTVIVAYLLCVTWATKQEKEDNQEAAPSSSLGPFALRRRTVSRRHTDSSSNHLKRRRVLHRRQFIQQNRAFIVQLRVDGNDNLNIASDAFTTASKQAQAALDNCLRLAGISFEEGIQFNRIFSGRSLFLHNQLHKKILGQCPQVLKVWPLKYLVTQNLPDAKVVNGTALSKAVGSSPEGHKIPIFAHTHALTGVSKLHEMGLTGKGVKGIDYGHPAFGSCERVGVGPNCRVKWGWDFVGDSFDGRTTVQDPEPYDNCHGHGTHVAGILGGRDEANGMLGVAPDAEFGVYRIFGCAQGGSATNDVFIAAMLKAFEDGMEIINLSLGSNSGFIDSPESWVTNELAKVGVLVVAAQGNLGQEGVWLASEPGVAEHATAVGSFDNTKTLLRHFSLSTAPERSIAFGFNQHPYAPPHPTYFNRAVVTTSFDLTNTRDACEPITSQNVQGMIVLVGRGGCDFSVKAVNVAQAGAAGILLFDRQIGRMVTPPDESYLVGGIPVWTISWSDGVFVADQIAKHGANVVVQFGMDDFAVDISAGGDISEFSSWGLGPDLQLKPDLAAPGGAIYSAWPREIGGYAISSGTSMSVPYVTGAYALHLQHRRQQNNQAKVDPLEVRARFQNMAVPVVKKDDQTARGLLWAVAQQGTGLIQVDRSTLTTSTVTPSKFSLGIVSSNTIDVEFTVWNTGSDRKTYRLAHEQATSVDIKDAEVPKATGSGSTAFFFAQNGSLQPTHSVTVEPQSQAKVRVQIHKDDDLNPSSHLFFYGGYIKVQPEGVEWPITIPYAGLHGDPRNIPFLDRSPEKAPPSVSYGSQIALNPSKDILTVDGFKPGKNCINIIYRLLMPIQSLTLNILDATQNNKYLGQAFRFERQGRSRSVFDPESPNKRWRRWRSWNGSFVDEGNQIQYVKDGEYTLQMVFQKGRFIGMEEVITATYELPRVRMTNFNNPAVEAPHSAALNLCG
ncbi:hypothetical protein HK102_004790, partial [Quaeritorhiza haematococci]